MSGSLVVGLLVGAALGFGAGLLIAGLRGRRRLAAAARETRSAASELADERRSNIESREVRDLILSSMEEGVLVVDRDGRRLFANDALGRHLGALPTGVHDLRPAAFAEATRQAGYTGAPIRLEVETGSPSRWLRASALPVGEEGAVLLVVRDVTDTRRLDAVRRDFVANASHELKSPAATIRATAETLRDGALHDPEAAARFADQLVAESVRLSRIVSDLLDLSRLESGGDLIDRVRLDGVAGEEVQRLAERAADAGVTLTLSADAVPSIAGSARDLALLMRNLVDNAIGYTPAGGSVGVEVRAVPDDGVRLTVRDTGVGIPQRDLSRIFERFYRVDRARSRETGGTGLGLAIVKHVAENHGADVAVTSELGAGTTFTITFPPGAAPAPASAPAATP